jgi:hypothetical protein
MALITTFETPNFKTKTECILLCVPGSRFTHKATNSKINSLTVFNTSNHITKAFAIPYRAIVMCPLLTLYLIP